MGNYDRLSDDEKLEKYIEFESDLFIFKQKPKSEEIQELTKKLEDGKETLRVLSRLYMLEATEPVIHSKAAYQEEDQTKERLQKQLKKLLKNDELVLDF